MQNHRTTLADLSDVLGKPAGTLYSSGSVMARFSCHPTDLDRALDSVEATVEFRADLPGDAGLSAVRVGWINNTRFHAEAILAAANDHCRVRIFNPPEAGTDSPQAFAALNEMADSVFALKDDPDTAIIAYLSYRLRTAPQRAPLLAANVTQLVADYLSGIAR